MRMGKMIVDFKWRSCTLALATIVCGAAHAQEITADGYFDFYFQNDSLKTPSNANLTGRAFDVKHNRWQTAVGQIGFSKAAAHKDPGFNLQFYWGPNADTIALGEPAGSKEYKFIRNAYVTWMMGSEKSPWTFDFGKFDTPIGYEGIDNRFQDNYSRSFNWSFSQPVYHTGLRASHAINAKTSAMAYVVTGWNEISDSNGRPSVGLSLTHQPNTKWSYTLNEYFGKEGSNSPNDAGVNGGIAFPAAGVKDLWMNDFIGVYLPDATSKWVVNYDYGQAKVAGAKGTWSGLDVYYRKDLSKGRALAFRLDHMEDTDGLRTGAPIKLDSATATYDWSFNKSLTLRFEARYDKSSNPFFVDSNGNLNKSRTTFAIAQILKF